jgi:hypothetical protein
MRNVEWYYGGKSKGQTSLRLAAGRVRERERTFGNDYTLFVASRKLPVCLCLAPTR